jgi:hypothetical protein
MNGTRVALLRLLRGVSVTLGLLLVAMVPGTRTQAKLQASTLIVSNPVCVQVARSNGICRINIRGIFANASDGSLVGVTVGINGALRARVNTFFENSINLTAPMLRDGLQVVCGPVGASGIPNAGRKYSVTVSTVVTGGSTLVDTTNVVCPAYGMATYLPVIRK